MKSKPKSNELAYKYWNKANNILKHVFIQN